MSEINRLADFILRYYGHEIGLGNPIEGESAVDVAIRLLTPQSSPNELDLIANLARRVEYLERKATSLEQQLRDTQNNVEKLAEELATVKHDCMPKSSAKLLAEAFEALGHYERSRGIR